MQCTGYRGSTSKKKNLHWVNSQYNIRAFSHTSPINVNGPKLSFIHHNTDCTWSALYQFEILTAGGGVPLARPDCCSALNLVILQMLL